MEYRTHTAMMEVNLFTNGRPLEVQGKVTGNHVNTAVSDMEDFCDYMDSEYVHDELGVLGMSCLFVGGEIRDLSSLENDTQYEFRAMAEFELNYVHETGGAYGVITMPEEVNPSGGGNELTHTEELSWIETVEVKYKGGQNEE